ncbi:hypothetical protein K3177_03260 [Qipengyuania sp. GH25]|uniref:Uncharacterized protein n=1 Tax=Qipengyuania pacifica TaxID=2860199 RepID=A0ABS7JFI4_9SPHN|nr:hypothetical protein [Qipengyuania aerophila]MBX7487524.1 hypothetical protein [Qipengyuania aerophila]
MTTLIWIVPAMILVFLLALVFRRALLTVLRFPHGFVLIVAVVAATGVTMAMNAALLPVALAAEPSAAIMIAGLMVGFLLTAREIRKPKGD